MATRIEKSGRRWARRPRLEALESRTLLALGLFIENFSDDLDPSRPGFDSWDDDPNTTFPDSLQVPHQISPRTFIEEHSVLQNTGDVPSPPHALFIPSGVTSGSYLSDFAATRGQPGGLGVDEEVASVAVRYTGIGLIRFQGANGTRTIRAETPSFGFWQNVTVTGNSLSDSGAELGAIRNVLVTPIEGLFIDDVAVLVLQSGFANNPPVANPDTVRTLPGAPVEIDALANDGDADRDPIRILRFDPLSQEGGTITVLPSGRFHYVPAPGFHGLDQFDYDLTDGRVPPGGEVRGTVRVIVNTPPPAPNITYDLAHDSFGEFTVPAPGVLEGLTDADGDPLTVELVRTPFFGEVELASDGSFSYVPTTPDERRLSDQFEYRAQDPFGTSDATGVVLLRIPDEAPVVRDRTFAFAHGLDARPLTFLLDYGEADDDPSTAVLIDGPEFGSVTFRDGGSDPANGRRFVAVEYRSVFGDLRSTDQFTYRIRNAYATSAIATVTLDVRQSAPVGNGDRYEIDVPRDELLAPYYDFAWGVLANDTDADSDPLEAILLSQPTHGRIEAFAANGTFRYYPPLAPFAPNDAFIFGRDTFTYRVSDGVASSPPVQVILSIRENRQASSAGEDGYSTPVAEVLNVPAPGVLANDEVDPNPGDPVVVILHTPPRYGTLVLGPDGSFTYVANNNFLGVDYFLYSKTDTFVSPEGEPSRVGSTLVRIIVFDGNTTNRDRDADGISDLEEDQTDGNNDRIADSTQPYVASQTTPLGIVTLKAGERLSTESDLGLPGFTQVVIAPGPPPEAPPTEFDFPFGFFSFRLLLSPNSFSGTRITLYLPAELPPDATFLKFGPEPGAPFPHWYAPEEIEVSTDRRRISFEVSDGGKGDHDLARNGVIVDPGGIAIPRRSGPRVEYVEINDGAIRRPRIRRVTVSFSGTVALADRAIQLVRKRGRRLIPFRQALVHTTVVDGRTVAVLTFPRRRFPGGGLPMGRFSLVIRNDRVRDQFGRALDGNADGAAGDDFSTTLRPRPLGR